MNAQQLRDKFKPRIVAVDHDGETYYVRNVKVSYVLGLIPHAGKGDHEQTVRGIAKCLCDENGNLVFSGDEGLDCVENMPPELFGKLFQAALRANSLTQEGFDDAKKN